MHTVLMEDAIAFIKNQRDVQPMSFSKGLSDAAVYINELITPSQC